MAGRPSLVSNDKTPKDSCQVFSVAPSPYLPEGLPSDWFQDDSGACRNLRGGGRLWLDLAGGRRKAAIRAELQSSAPTVSDYLESVAETSTWEYEEPTCGQWGRVGVCHCGQKAAMQLICNRDWCPVCGGYVQRAHRRRIASWIEYLEESLSWGYFVLTIPAELRSEYRNSESLGKVGTAARRLLKRHGFDKGLRRWHWFGEPKGTDYGDTPDGSGGVPRFHPHLNCLVPGGFIEKTKLEAIKRGWARILKTKRVVVHYSYSEERAKLWHWLKYVTRPTFLDRSWDPDLALALRRFRNSSPWGKWTGEKAWECDTSDLDLGPEGEEMSKDRKKQKRMIEKGLCPCCGEKLTWLPNAVPIRDLVDLGFLDLGDGVFMDMGIPPGLRGDGVVRG